MDELTDEFKQWILTRAKNTKSTEMVEDDVFICRLLTDVLHGRSKKFNKSSKKGGVGGLNYLRLEFDGSKNMDSEVVSMSQMICSKCYGSLTTVKKDDETFYRCVLCGTRFDEIPKVNPWKSREKTYKTKKEE
jgi:DNA-directed RNA polymerase subunit RPC12/RpoP